MRRTTRRKADPDLLRLREVWLRDILVQQLARGEMIASWCALFAPTFMPLTRPPTIEEVRDRPEDFIDTPTGWFGRLPRAERYTWTGARALTLTMDSGGFVLRLPNGQIIRDREQARSLGLSFVAGRGGPEPDAQLVDLIDWLPSGRRRATRGRGRAVSVLARALYVRAALAAGVSHYAAVQEIARSFPQLLPPADLEAWTAIQPRVSRWDDQPVRDERLEKRGMWLQATRRLQSQHSDVWAQLGLGANLR